MLKLHESALAILAVFFAVPEPVFPPGVVIGLSMVCLSAVMFTLISALRRKWPERRPVVARRSQYPR